MAPLPQRGPLALALLALSACSTVAGVQEAAPAAGVQARLAATLPQVQEAALGAFAANGLGVQSINPEGDSAWVIVVSRGLTFWSYGEIVRVRAALVDSATTSVWIYAQRRLATNLTAKGDWPEILFADIRDQLRGIQVSVPSDWIVFHDGLLRVLDVSISPGDTTPFHTHDAAVVYIPIALSATDAQVSGGDWGVVGPESASRLKVGTASSDLVYVNRPLEHRVANIGPDEFRVFEIVNAGSGVPPGTGPSLPGDLLMTSSWFRQSTLVLDAGKHTRWFSGEMPVVVLVPGTGQVTVERAATDIAYDPPPDLKVALGGWAFVPAGARYRIENAGVGRSTVMVVEVRQKLPAPSSSH